MVNFRYGSVLLAVTILAAPALAKDETLADRGKRMCEEAGIPLWECMILPPEDRPIQPVEIAKAIPTLKPFGTGKYGWCSNCTSIFAAAPVEPWGSFGGRTRSKSRDEDDKTTVADAGTSSSHGGGGNGGGNCE